MSNPIYTALLITALVLVIILGVFHYKKITFKDKMRAFVYVFFATTLVLFIHHYSVLNSLKESTSQRGVRDLFTSIHTNRDVPGSIPVIPNITGGGDANANGANDTNIFDDIVESTKPPIIINNIPPRPSISNVKLANKIL
jgi:hypothetical protein